MTCNWNVSWLIVVAAAVFVTATKAGSPPDSVSGLELWLDATDNSTFTLSGTDVTEWRDKSGNLHHATPAFGSPVLVPGAIGGQQAVRFNRDPLNIAGNLGIGAGQGRSTFTVINYSTLTNNSEIAGTSTVAMMDVGTFFQSQRLRLRDTSSGLSGDDGFSGIYSGNGSLPIGSHLLTVNANARGPATTLAQADGNTILDRTGSFQHFPIGTDYQVGGANFAGREYIGDIAEHIVYDRSLDLYETNDVGHGLQDKYGLSGSYVQRNTSSGGTLPVTDGLQLWLDADDPDTLSLDFDQVTEWRDKSGQNHDAVATGDAPTLTLGALNGRPVVSFDRTPLDIASGLDIGSGEDRTILMVMDYTANIQNSEIFGTATGTMIDVGNFFQDERLRLRDTESNGGSGGDDGFSGVYSGDDTLPFGTHLITIEASAAGTLASSDGMEIINTPGAFSHFDLNSSSLQIGGANFAGREYVGNIAEFLVYDRLLTSSELGQIQVYLDRKYDLGVTSVIPEPHSAILITGLGLLLWTRNGRPSRTGT